MAYFGKSPKNTFRNFLIDQKKRNRISTAFANFIRKGYLRHINYYQLQAIANNMETWFVKDRYVEKLFESNHEVSKFIQTMCYSGMEDESVTETRVRIYSQLRTKTS